MGIRPRASALSRYASILFIAHIGSECTKAISSGSMGSRGNPDLGSASYPIQPGFFMLYRRDRATSPSPAPKIALSHHVAPGGSSSAANPPEIKSPSCPKQDGTTSCYHWVKRWPGLPPMETRTVVLHSDRDNHKSPNNETGAGNTESDRVLIGRILSKDALGTTAGLSFPSGMLGCGRRMASESLTGWFLASPITSQPGELAAPI